MKAVILSLLLAFSAQSFAAATLFCTAEDGTTVWATEGADSRELYDIRVRIREGEIKPYPDAYVALKLEDTDGHIGQLVITDPAEGILITVIEGSLVDRTGTYEVFECQISM